MLRPVSSPVLKLRLAVIVALGIGATTWMPEIFARRVTNDSSVAVLQLTHLACDPASVCRGHIRIID